MKIFFDTEFTGLNKDTDLLTIGLIDEDGKHFYGEILDYDPNKLNKWVIENIIAHTTWLKNYPEKGYLIFNNNNHGNTKCVGSKADIKRFLLEWLKQYDEIEFVSDVAHYDFVLVIDLLAGCALEMPNKISPVCIDINPMIAEYKGISHKEAFDYNREDLINESIKGEKHNSLYDAKVIKAIYEKITKK